MSEDDDRIELVNQAIDECEGCGADLFFGDVHDCPVLGTTVEVTDVV